MASATVEEPQASPAHGGEQAAGSSGGRRRRLLWVVLVLALVVGAGGALLMRAAGADETDGAPAGEQTGPAEPDEIVEVGQLTINAAESAGSFVRLTFAVGLAEGVPADEVEGRFPLLKEAVIREVQRVPASELRGPEGFDGLQAALEERAQGIYPDGQIVRVVITEFLVQ